jgi:hypothetical protein
MPTAWVSEDGKAVCGHCGAHYKMSAYLHVHPNCPQKETRINKKKEIKK